MSLSRVAITGLPCPPGAWEEFLADGLPTRIVPLYEVFENTTSNDMRLMADYVGKVFIENKPTSIVAHDFGVPLTLLALLRMARHGHRSQAKLTLFNGAFRKGGLFRQTHAYRIHFMSYRAAEKEIQSRGGQIDPRLKEHLPRIRGLFRTLLTYSLIEQLQEMIGLEDLVQFSGRALVDNPIQIIASPNDPYISMSSIEQLRRDFGAGRFIEKNYGHFPYSVARQEILPLLQEFEGSAEANGQNLH